MYSESYDGLCSSSVPWCGMRALERARTSTAARGQGTRGVRASDREGVRGDTFA